MNQCHFERSASGSFTRGLGIRSLNMRTPFVNYFVQNVSLVYELQHTEKLKSISILIERSLSIVLELSQHLVLVQETFSACSAVSSFFSILIA